MTNSRYSNSPSSYVDVWLVDLKSPTLAQFQLLSEAERIRANAFVRSDRRTGYIVAHATLRKILSEYSGIFPFELSFEEGRDGKPKLKYPRDLHFNLSHSDTFALIAISRSGAVGIDLEDKTKEPAWEIIGQVFTENEQAYLTSLSTKKRKEAFYECWCRKEALVKADGVGLNIDLTQLEVIGENFCELNRKRYFYDLPEIEGHASSLVASEALLEINMRSYV